MAYRFKIQNVVWLILTGCIMLLFALLGRHLSELYVDLILSRIGVGGRLEFCSRIGLIIIMALIGYLIGSPLGARASEVMLRLDKIPLADKLAALFGILLGLILSYLILLPPLTVMRGKLPIETVFVIVALVLVPTLYICLRIMLGVKEELSRFFPRLLRTQMSVATENQTGEGYASPRPKLLDTSVIIDGRLNGIVAAGFLEGKLLIPDFILQELQRIRDSEDPIKRARGRRGLQMLDELKRIYPHRIEVVESYSSSVERGPNVDMKLIRLAEELDATIVTNDDGLQRIARLHKVAVLNVNVLADALKFVVLPGEELDVYLVREGTQAGQGVGYLDDGTMVVVEGGKRHVGKRVHTVVRNVSQTAGGRIIFAEFVRELHEEEGDLFDESGSHSSRGRAGN